MVFAVIKSLLVLIIIGGLLFAATKFVPGFQGKISSHVPLLQKTGVLGATTASSSADRPLSDSLKKDAKEQLDQAKDSALHINLSDILQEVNRLQKIPKDAENLTKTITDEVSSLLKKKP